MMCVQTKHVTHLSGNRIRKLLAEVKASCRIDLRESTLESAHSNGSKDNYESASRTVGKPLDGTKGLHMGRNRCAPFINLFIRGFCPTCAPPKAT